MHRDNMKRIALVVTAVLCGCSHIHNQQPSGALLSSPAQNWRRYDGEGFTLRYPADAKRYSATSHPSNLPGTAIRGPNVPLAIPLSDGSSDRPAFQLIVSAFPNPTGYTVEQWVDSIRQGWNKHDLDPDSLDFLRPADTVAVNGLNGLRLRPFCTDCVAEEVYFSNAKHTVVLSYVFDASFPGDREAQRKLYHAIVSTFAWNHTQDSSPARPNTR